MLMSKNEAVAYLKDRLPDYLNEKGLPLKKKFKCLNPSHDDVYGTMAFFADAKRVRCFDCHAQYDVLDLIGMDYHLDYLGSLRFAADKYGVEIAADTQMPFVVKKGVTNMPEKKSDSEFIADSCKNISKAVVYLGSRGIDSDLVQRFHIGSSTYYDTFSEQRWDVVVFPLSEKSAVVRNMDSSADKKNRYRKIGPAGIWNLAALQDGINSGRCVFITEGEIDALSIIMAGGLAVALGGVDYKALGAALGSLKTTQKNRLTIIAACDNDEKGKETNIGIQELAKSVNCRCYSFPNLFANYKDANARYLKDRERFIKLIKAIQTVEGVEAYLILRGHTGNNILAFERNALESGFVEKPIPTGFDQVDQLLNGGISYGQLYLFGAVPGVGKTTFLLQMADNFAMGGNDVLFFTLDMLEKELVAKSISRLTYELCETPSSGYRLSDAWLANEVFGHDRSLHGDTGVKVLNDTFMRYQSFGNRIVYLGGTTNYTIIDINKAVLGYIGLTGHKPIVFVDYLQRIKPIDTRVDDKKAVDLVVYGLKDMVKNQGVPVLAVSSFNRENYWQSVRFNSFKETGGLEYEANAIFGMEYTGTGKKGFDFERASGAEKAKIDLVLIKNKMGIKSKRIQYQFYQKFNYFSELGSGQLQSERKLRQM